ncbi:cobyrinic acid a,c-diamide synthase [Nostoc sp. CENA543]|uniref:cobyrinate a,c-diamide synthase n=1 Tax=Nostoc sp. CENA543 TaxID=1869241 RepID=UPI000CA36E85|nr:cobyrinate a,c-diamide synthase [Nostoc sp. CENA543]AUT02298.1 cobyrinic acid a,c-diamide synthase [Nostoc sp. CENA543]
MAVVIAGERSGVGKTTITLTLLASLCRRGATVQSFKVGPDYIDPMFHTYVTGRACRNLDPVLTSETYVRQCFARHHQESEYALVEGVMGLFDGIGHRASGIEYGKEDVLSTQHFALSTDFASTAHIARLLDLPVVLVIDCSRLSGSVAAIAHGYCSFDPRIKIAGLVLNRVGSDRHLSLLKNALQPLQLPILGVLRRQDNITIPDRHLGLIPTAELPELDTVIHRLADLGDTCFDWQTLLPLLGTGDWDIGGRGQGAGRSGEIFLPLLPAPCSNSSCMPVKIAVARDRAFNFYYQDNLDILENLGAELVFWSPLTDKELPPGVQGMYFGGGFPEVFAQQLAANNNARESVKQAILDGMPTIAECGGLMYLCEQIIDFEGQSWSMVGILPTSAVMDKKLTLGYRRAVALQDNLLVKAGSNLYGHEFHRSHVISNCEQPLFTTYRFDVEENLGFEGWCSPKNIHASYIHLHWGNSLEIPHNFLQQCLNFKYLNSKC